ncbi:hypothetical protein Q0M83_14815, partial [Staphylococcus aureus]|nr:hypothetical protein [Staphylococcus aureus]
RAATTAVTIAPAACGLAEGVAGITLPANGVVDSTGAVVANVRIEMAPLPVLIGGRRAPDVMSAFPGDLAAIDDDGAPALLE